MPGVGGVALVQKLRERRPDLKVLFMSGYADDADSGLADGAALLRKPFSPEQLLAAVAKALDRSP
jgi:CheY-like chemotaxis protein